MNLLYEDKHLCLAVKPTGVLSEDHPTKICMPALLREHFKALGKHDYIATVHRLDKVVGGIMLFSRSPAVTGKLTGLIARHEVEKEYFAILRGRPEKDEDTLEDLLFHDSTHNKSFVVSRERKGVRKASLSYSVLGYCEAEDLTLVRVHLHTGRTHQIRVQFSHRKLPLLGDIRYGSKADCDPALWSFHLAFVHPQTRKKVDVMAAPPMEYPWTLFAGEIGGVVGC